MRNSILFIFLVLSVSLYAQPDGVTTEMIKSNQIKSISTVLDMASDDPELEGLEIGQYDFDEEGRCIRKKHVNPLFDVVTTSNEYFFTFDVQGNMIEKIKVHNTEDLVEKDKKFIGIFGATSDTTISKYVFNADNKILKEIEFEVGKKDTSVINFDYTNLLLTRSTHFSTMCKGELNINNFTKKYYYDDLDRIVRIEKTPHSMNLHSTVLVTYDGDTEIELERRTINDFSWVTTFFDGKSSKKVSQNTIDGTIKKYEYDSDKHLVKETLFRSRLDLTSNYNGSIYVYEKDLLMEEQTFNKSSSVILLRDKINYEYDSKGFLKKEKRYYKGELGYSYVYKYESR